ncbi:hypothetical protein V8E53_010051 [Lactarius tabidus]
MRPNEATTPENRRIEFATLISPLVGYVADERLRGKLPFQKGTSELTVTGLDELLPVGVPGCALHSPVGILFSFPHPRKAHSTHLAGDTSLSTSDLIADSANARRAQRTILLLSAALKDRICPAKGASAWILVDGLAPASGRKSKTRSRDRR